MQKHKDLPSKNIWQEMDIQTGTRTGTVFQAKFFLAYLLPVIIFFFFSPKQAGLKKNTQDLNN